jgi:hypothetical protein
MILEAAAEPVFGRQYDDRDLFALSRLGHGLQILDPRPSLRQCVALAPVVPGATTGSDPQHRLLSTPVERGGVGGHLDLLLGSIGRGVAPEARATVRTGTAS